MLDEIFAELSAHMIRGLMIHEQMSQYFLFLGLDGYAKEQEFRFHEESDAHHKLNEMYLLHTDKLIPERRIDSPNIIPPSWYDAKRSDVDNATRKNAVKTAYSKWREWETETKKLYQDSYTKLVNANEAALADYVGELVKDVDTELIRVMVFCYYKASTEYDLVDIIEEQHDYLMRYTDKMGG